MSRTYFVSYHATMNSGYCFGMLEITMGIGIETMSDVIAASKTTQDMIPGCTGVVILNWKEIDPQPGPQGDKGGA